jgi:hypothetical protein
MKYKFKDKDKHIIDVIDHLDVQKIYSVMKFLKWTWRGESVSIGKIYSELTSRLHEVIKEFENTDYDGVEEVYYGSETGGIRIGIRLDEKEEPYLDVMFILTQWESSVEN